MAKRPQYADRVNVVKQVRVERKWRFAAVVEKSGKVVRDHVWIAGEDQHHSEGTYYLEWYEDGKRRRKAVHDFASVIEAARCKAIELDALKPACSRAPNS